MFVIVVEEVSFGVVIAVVEHGEELVREGRCGLERYLLWERFTYFYMYQLIFIYFL